MIYNSAHYLAPGSRRRHHVHVGQMLPPAPPQQPLLANVSPTIWAPVVVGVFTGLAVLYLGAITIGFVRTWPIAGAVAVCAIGYGYATHVGTGWQNVPAAQ